MKLFGTSAFIYWRLASCLGARATSEVASRRFAKELCAEASSFLQSPEPPFPDDVPLPRGCDALLGQCAAPDGLLHLEVADALSRSSKRNEAPSCSFHVRTAHAVWSWWLPGAFGLKISTPELCFLQLASQVSLPHLAIAGLELCGTYSVVPDKDGAFVKRPPLTSRSALLALLDKAVSAYGVKQARQALRFVADGAASPQEARLYLLLSMPVRMGGYGLPPAQLNYRVETNAAGGVDPACRYRVCDLYWPDHQVAVEYESDAFHTGAEKITSDSIRRTALTTRGVSVVTVTAAQLRSPMMTDQVVAALCRKLGVRKRSCLRDWSQQRDELRRALFETPSTPLS